MTTPQWTVDDGMLVFDVVPNEDGDNDCRALISPYYVYDDEAYAALVADVAAARLVDDMAAVIDAAHLARQREWSTATFGPGRRTGGVIDHIRKELEEIEADPDDLSEWVDVVILALDGAWRHGWEPQQIIDAIKAKQARNEAREWPDWRTLSQDEAIEHVRSPGEVAALHHARQQEGT